MSIAGKIGKVVLGLVAGGIAVLAALMVRDDRQVAGIWRQLEEISRGSGTPFEAEMVADLPDPARRYFLHAIQPGTPLASGFHWRYRGELRTSVDTPWMGLSADQILVRDRGFVWKATVSQPPLFLTGADHYLDGESRMRIALFGLVPVVNASGPDISRSASARLLIEGVALPPALLPGQNVTIEPVDASRFRARIRVGEWETPVTVTVDEVGRATEVVLDRWGDYTPDKSFRLIPYGAKLGDEATFGNYTIPTSISVGWWYGTPDYLEVIRLKLDWIEYL